MTTSNGVRAAATPPTSLGGAFSDVVNAALGVVAAKVDDWSNKLDDVAAGGSTARPDAVEKVADDVAEGGDAKQQAGVRGVQAGIEGSNPVWAAVKGAWAGSSTPVKVAIVAAGVVLLVLSPVLLVVLLVTVPIVVVVSKSRSAKK
ncbi:hypothetical protein ABE437_05725 [Isoptericola cucumis]|uniref:hypothetical protein n=1 Tax=Isoptericola cucumis TaxID=1776856 RepID=UPI00320AC5A5